MSWHYNHIKDVSIIKDCVDLLNDNNEMHIYTDKRVFVITNKDKIEVGDGAMMIVIDINDNDIIQVINTNIIHYIEIKPKKGVFDAIVR